MGPRSARWILAALLLVAAGFAWGMLAEREGLFPRPWLAGLYRALFRDPEPEQGRDAAPDPTFPDGWWELVRRPGGPDREEVLRGLEQLGYLPSYEAGGGEVGVTVRDPRAQPGKNLIVSAHGPEVLLADMDGNVVHAWRYDFADAPLPAGTPPPPSLAGTKFFRRARMLADGGLLGLYERTGLVRLDRDSNLVWALPGLYHHDLDVAADGTIWVLSHEVRVIPRIHPTRATFEDFVNRVSPDGDVLARFSLLEAFERSPFAPLLAHAPDREDIFHTNTLEILEEECAHLPPPFGPGKALISVWGLDAVALVDLEERAVEWALAGLWRRQHEPQLLESGNLLVFDNLGGAGGMSRVLEVEPFTQRIAWSFEGNEENDFQSALCGSCQRLANGNTLITESLSGRAFEVTPAGEVVWKWSSPYRVGPNGEGVAVLMEVVRLEE